MTMAEICPFMFYYQASRSLRVGDFKSLSRLKNVSHEISKAV